MEDPQACKIMGGMWLYPITYETTSFFPYFLIIKSYGIPHSEEKILTIDQCGA
jgi:hypothetical protein